MSRCRATARRTGQQCQKRAVAGATVCLSHGAAASQVRRAARERVALARAVELIGDDATADPQQVLLTAVRASAAMLGGAEAALQADDADSGTLQQLAEAALLAGRLAKLALDSGLEERLVATAEQHGVLVAGVLRRVIEGAGLGPERENALYRSLAQELRAMDGYKHDNGRIELDSIWQIDARIGKLTAELVAHEHAEAAREAADQLPGKIAAAIAAGFGVLDLDEADQERVVVAVEGYLRLQAEAADQPQTGPADQQQASVGAWWLAAHQRRDGDGR